jgi:hypothetical protein
MIEIRRDLYMDENTGNRNNRFELIKYNFKNIIQQINLNI